MRVLIIEDEEPAAKRLKKLLLELDGSIEVLALLDGLKSTIKWFGQNKEPDLILLDINLSDGMGLRLFEKLNINCPVVFTTAYDEYAVQAFRLGSLDYLLKPIDKSELRDALARVDRHLTQSDLKLVSARINEMMEGKKYKRRFLIRVGDQLKFIQQEQIAYFKSEQGSSVLYTKDKGRFVVDEKLEALENSCDPEVFYRVNRSLLVSMGAIEKITNHFNGRLKLRLIPELEDDELVSRERVAGFKNWLES